MIGATVAAHAVIAPIAGEVETETPFGLGAVAGYGYNPHRRLSELFRASESIDHAAEIDAAIDAVVSEAFKPPTIDLDEIYQRYLDQQAQRLAAMAELDAASRLDDGETVINMWESELVMVSKIVGAIVEQAGREVGDRHNDMDDLQRLLNEDQERTMEALRALFSGLMRGTNSVH